MESQTRDRSRSPKGFRKRWQSGIDTSPIQVEPVLVEDEPEPSVQTSSEPSSSSHVDLQSMSKHISGVAAANAYQLTRSSDIRLPWQKGPLAPIFSRNSGIFRPISVWNMPRVGLIDMYRPAAKSQAIRSVPQLSDAVSTFAKQRIAASKFYVPEDELRTKALNQFKVLILIDLKATALGSSMMDVAGSLDATTNVLSVLTDALSSKATGTLLKRAGSMWRYAQWVVQNIGGSCFGQPERVVYEYVSFLKSSNAAPTSASHFLEALTFCDSIFRFTCNASDVVMSARVKGSAHAQFLNKRILKQAPAFPVSCVEHLEAVCIASTEVHKQVIAGSILFCIFACARWSDAMHIRSISLDKHASFVILEASTAKHKTSMTKEAKTRLLPYTCLGKFLTEESWAEAYMRARTVAGVEEGGLFQPSWNDIGGSWAPHPMTSGECTCWLNEFLESFDSLFSSHSCKTTLLTWCGMTNLLTREERTLLGHHVEPQQKSATTYNRDSQILLMYKVQRVLDLIKSGQLKPDASRAERLSMMFEENESNVVPLKGVELAEEKPLNLESDDDSNDADLSDEDHACLDLGNQERGEVPPDSILYSWYVHRLSSILHAKDSLVGNKLCCGRSITPNLKEIEHEQINSQIHFMCHQCNSNIKHGLNAVLLEQTDDDA